MALKQIPREWEIHDVGSQFRQNVIGELLSGISRLRGGQLVWTEEDDRPPIDAINANIDGH